MKGNGNLNKEQFKKQLVIGLLLIVFFSVEFYWVFPSGFFSIPSLV